MLEKPGTVLAIGAHYDDIEICCGGTMALAVLRGWRAHMLVITHSAYLSVNNVDRTTGIAKYEGNEGAKILGAQLHCLDLDVGLLEWNKHLVQAINALIDEIKPDVVLTHFSNDTHQDHYYTAMSTISAARFVPNILMYEPFYPSGRGSFAFNPQLHVDISETMEIKSKALQQHRTQVERYGRDWILAIQARARFRGFESACTYAEAFQVLRMSIK